MAVYVDKLRNWGWKLGPSCHLITDGSNEELHTFAESIGLKRDWFQKSISGPHYDLTASKRIMAINKGAIELSDKEFVEILRRWRNAAIAKIKLAANDKERDAIREELFR
mgnify:CR=1 FL=1